MKHSLTAVLAIVSAAGLAGIAQAQTTAQPAATPTPSAEGTAPNTQYQSSTAPASPSAAQPTTTATAPKAAPQANMQQSSGNDFWSRNISQDEVRQAQQQLAAQGLYRGSVDGLAGPEMQRALARFQQQNGLRRTATLDPDTMNRLMASNAPANAPGAGASAPPTGPAVGASTPPTGTPAPVGAGGSATAAPAAPTATQDQPATRY
jgi:peptidoglycan hydrolase-like protein with peptidoglycan-binding domain